jgi:DNA-binding winged helix-turn-helix (wHTH) protein
MAYRFGPFLLDPADRQLRRDGEPQELNARYLDALTLMVREAGKLVSKDRFLDEVWRGVPVTDEALTQCIRTLRRALGDDAGRPSFIETVPKHGYRFIATVDAGDGAPAPHAPHAPFRPEWSQALLMGAAGTLGAGAAGIAGGLVYGFAAAAQPGTGAASVLLVLLCVTLLVALVGGGGVAFGIAAAGLARSRLWRIAGGAAGGLIVGAVVKLLGLDAFNLLFGQAPAGITGATEGLLLGAGVGIGVWLADRIASPRRAAAIAALMGAAAGVVIALTGGRLLGGSLALLAAEFPQSRLRLDAVGALFGESGFGPVSHVVTAGLEGALFAGGLVAAMLFAQRRSR